MLSNKALVVSLTISQWTGRKLDKPATEQVESSFSTDRQVGNYTKKLLPGAKELSEITRIAGSIRTFFYHNTLPWHTDGARIIKSTAYLDFVKEFGAKRSEFDHAVSEFLNAYPVLKEDAKTKLGQLFREVEYPTVDKLSSTFHCDISFMPVPDIGDFRVEILDSEKESFLKRMQDTEKNAMRECWNRLYDLVHGAVAKLQSSDSVFRDSQIENIQELCSLLPKLNITDDPELERMRSEVESAVACISPKECRESVFARIEASKKLEDITSKMSAFMGV